jgi:hypothetical protein
MEEQEETSAYSKQRERNFITQDLDECLGAGIITGIQYDAEKSPDKWTVTYRGLNNDSCERELNSSNEAIAFLAGCAATVISTEKMDLHNRITVTLKAMACWATFRIESIADYPEYRWELRRSDGEIIVLDNEEVALTYLSNNV